MPSTPPAPAHPPEDDYLFAHQVVGENLRRHRGEAGISQSEVAQRMAGLGYMTWTKTLVSQFENGHRGVSLTEFLALSVVLDIPPLRLLDPTAIGDGFLDFGAGVAHTAEGIERMFARR